jgi:DNA-binding transcriptional LysR family regulator
MTFGRYVLAPVVAGFLDAHAQIGVAMLQVERMVDLIDEGADLAVRIGPLPDSKLMARRVGFVRRMLVASPDYVASRGAPGTPSGLADHQVIRLPV